MMTSKIETQFSNQYIQLNTVAAKNAYITFAVYIIFFVSLVFYQENLPFDLPLVGLVTLSQLLICIFHTVSIGKSGYNTSVFLCLFSIIILNLSEFNKLLCEYANLKFMIYMSTIIIISIPYYRVACQNKIDEIMLRSEKPAQLDVQLQIVHEESKQ